MIKEFIKKLFIKNNRLKEVYSETDLKIHDEPILKTPDYPTFIGYKVAWLAIKSNSPQDVIKVLDLKLISDCNWEYGLNAVHKKDFIFVSPCLDGFVLVVGIDFEFSIDKLIHSSKFFEEVQLFGTNRVVEYHKWIKVRKGKLIRAYSYIGESDEVLIDEGDMTDEEKQLGFSSYKNIQDNLDEECDIDLPDEESVLIIASAWGIDINLDKKEHCKSTGFLCILN